MRSPQVRSKETQLELENYKAGRVIHGPVIPADFYQQLSAERWLLSESPISLQPRDSTGHTWLWSQDSSRRLHGRGPVHSAFGYFIQKKKGSSPN